MVSFGVHIFRPITGYYRGSGAVAYLGFHKGGPNFRWPLVLTQRGGQTMFTYFFSCEKFFLPKGGMAQWPPKYATAQGVQIQTRTLFSHSQPLLPPNGHTPTPTTNPWIETIRKFTFKISGGLDPRTLLRPATSLYILTKIGGGSTPIGGGSTPIHLNPGHTFSSLNLHSPTEPIVRGEPATHSRDSSLT